MKKFFRQVLVSALCLAACFSVTAQDSEDIDDLFNSSEDLDQPVITEKNEEPVEKSSDDQKRGITWLGDLSSKLGGNIWFVPRNQEPGATFNNKLGFMSNTQDGWFHMEGSILAQFPQMQLGLYELFFNYMPYQCMTITAGRKDVIWGPNHILDTNILDDQSDKEVEADEILYKRDRKPEDSKFTVGVIIPFPPYITISGYAFYSDYSGNWNVGPNDVSYAAKVDTKIWRFSISVFTRSWAYDDPKAYDPALGCDVEFNPFDFTMYKSDIYGQYVYHFAKNDPEYASRLKMTIGTWQYIKDPVRFGLRGEFQYLFDDSKKMSEVHNYYFTAEAAWKHWLGNSGRDLTIALKWFYDMTESYGTFVPGFQVDDIIKYATLKVGFPIYYGSKNKVGMALELGLAVKY